MKSLDLLVIEDDDAHAEIIRRNLNRLGDVRIRLTREEKLQSGLNRLGLKKFDALLLDLRLPDSDIQDTLQRAVSAFPELPIIVLSSLEDRTIAIKSVQEGAEDYLCKSNLSPDLLVRTIFNSIERKDNELKIKRQLQKNAFLYELSLYALNESLLERIKIRCRETLMISLLVDYVEIIEQQISLTSLKQSLTDKNHSLHVEELQELGLGILKERISKEDLKSGIIIPLGGKETHSVFGVIAIFSYKQRVFKEEDITFAQSVANILTSLLIRKKLQDQLHQKILDLQDAHQKKDDFLATLSHELRTPLNIITGYLEILKDTDSNSENFQRSIAGIETNLRLETKLIEDTLDLSRIVTGKMKLNLTTFNLKESISGVIESISPAASAKNISLTSDIAENLFTFHGDQNRIQQIIWNLLSNAVKFTPTNGTIEIKAFIKNSLFHFAVADNGYGIAPENLKYVFNRFWQEDSSISRQHMGLGLGLGIVRQVVELHGGTVSVESKGSNQGANFSFKIPVSVATQNPTQHPPQPPTQLQASQKIKTAQPFLQSKRLLIIDDSEDTVALLKHLLKKAGAEVTGCVNPQTALQTAKENDFDLIISDIGMPGLNGYELLKEYRQWELKEHHFPHTPAIALTAYATEDDAKQALKAGFQIHLPKPMNLKDLEAKIKDLII